MMGNIEKVKNGVVNTDLSGNTTKHASFSAHRIHFLRLSEKQ
jgi:hypothetical protein